MKASERPIQDLIEKYKNDPGSLSVDELKALTKYKAMQSAARKPKKAPASPRRRKGETLADRCERLRHRDLDLIEAKQCRGETLTESDRRAIREIVASTSAPATPAKTKALVDTNIAKALQFSRLRSFHRLNELLDSSREDVSLRACELLKQWADDEPSPDDIAPFTLKLVEPKHFETPHQDLLEKQGSQSA